MQLLGIAETIDPLEVRSPSLLCHQGPGGVTVSVVVSEHLATPPIYAVAVMVVVPGLTPVAKVENEAEGSELGLTVATPEFVEEKVMGLIVPFCSDVTVAKKLTLDPVVTIPGFGTSDIEHVGGGGGGGGGKQAA